MAFSFNLCATAFVDYIFAVPQRSCRTRPRRSLSRRRLPLGNAPEKQINVTFLRNNLDMLARYNRRVVEQCYKRVYCSVKDGLVLSEPRFDAAATVALPS